MKRSLISYYLIIFGILSCGVGEQFMIKKERYEFEAQYQPKYMNKSLPKLPDHLIMLEKTLFYKSEKELIEVEGKSAGIPEDVKRIYLMLFTDFTHNKDLQLDFDRNLRKELQKFGLDIVAKLKYAQLIVSGKIKTFFITQAERITNIPYALLYTMIVEYSVEDENHQYLQENQQIKLDYLVLDTNTYTTNLLIPRMLSEVAQRTAQAIYYGWQLEYSKYEGTMTIIGEYNNDTYLSTNRP